MLGCMTLYRLQPVQPVAVQRLLTAVLAATIAVWMAASHLPCRLGGYARDLELECWL